MNSTSKFLLYTIVLRKIKLIQLELNQLVEHFPCLVFSVMTATITRINNTQQSVFLFAYSVSLFTLSLLSKSSSLSSFLSHYPATKDISSKRLLTPFVTGTRKLSVSIKYLCLFLPSFPITLPPYTSLAQDYLPPKKLSISIKELKLSKAHGQTCFDICPQSRKQSVL